MIHSELTVVATFDEKSLRPSEPLTSVTQLVTHISLKFEKKKKYIRTNERISKELTRRSFSLSFPFNLILERSQLHGLETSARKKEKNAYKIATMTLKVRRTRKGGIAVRLIASRTSVDRSRSCEITRCIDGDSIASLTSGARFTAQFSSDCSLLEIAKIPRDRMYACTRFACESPSSPRHRYPSPCPEYRGKT